MDSIFFLICLIYETIFHLYFKNYLYCNNIIFQIHFFIFPQANKTLRKKQGFSSLLSLSEVYRGKRIQQMLMSPKFLFIHVYSALTESGSPTVYRNKCIFSQGSLAVSALMGQDTSWTPAVTQAIYTAQILQNAMNYYGIPCKKPIISCKKQCGEGSRKSTCELHVLHCPMITLSNRPGEGPKCSWYMAKTRLRIINWHRGRK